MQTTDPTFDAPKDISERAQQFSPDFVKAFPHAVAYVMSNVLDPFTHKKIAEGLSKSLPWLLSNTSYAGQPGATLPTFREAFYLPPAGREAVRNSLILAKNLTRDQQQHSLSALDQAARSAYIGAPTSAPDTLVTGGNPEGGAVVAGVPYEEQGAFQQSEQAKLLDLAKDWQDAKARFIAAEKNAVYTPQPGRGGFGGKAPTQKNVPFVNGMPAVATTPEGHKAEEDLLRINQEYQNFIDPFSLKDPAFVRMFELGLRATQEPLQAVWDLAHGDPAAAGWDISHAARDVLGTASYAAASFSGALSGAAQLGGELLGHIGIGSLGGVEANLQSLVTPIAWLPSTFFRTVYTVANGISTPITENIVGLNPGDPGFNYVNGIINFAITSELLKGVGGFERAIGAAREAPAVLEVSAEDARAAREAQGIAQPRSLLGIPLPEGTAAQLEARFGGQIWGRLNRRIYNLVKESPEQWIRTSTVGKRAIRTVEKIKERFPKHEWAGMFEKAIPQLLPEEADMLTRASSSEDIARALEGRFQKIDWTRVSELQKNIRAIDRELRGQSGSPLDVALNKVNNLKNSITGLKAYLGSVERPTMGSEGFLSPEVEEQPLRSAISVSRAETLQQYPRGTDATQRIPALGGLYELTFGEEEAKAFFRELNTLPRPEALQRLEEAIPQEAELSFIRDALARQTESPAERSRNIKQKIAERQTQLDAATAEASMHEANLRTARLTAQDELTRIKPVETPWGVPKSSVMTRIMRGAPLNKFEKAMAAFWNPISLFGLEKLPILRLGEDGKLHIGTRNVRAASLSRAFDDMPDTRIFPPGLGPPDAFSRGKETIIKMGQRLGIDNRLVSKLLSDYSKLKPGDAEGFYRWASDLVDAMSSSKFIAPDFVKHVRSIINQHRSANESSFGFVGDQQVLQDAEGHALPSQVNELLNPIRLPNLDRMIDATSYFRELERNLRERGGPGKLILLPWDIVHGALSWSTSIAKALVLNARVLGALPLRILGEEWARNYFVGSKGVVRGAKDLGPHGGVTQDIVDSLGSLNREFQTDALPTRKTYPVVDTSHLQPGMDIPQYANDAIFRRISMMASDEGMRELAARGPKGFVKWLDSAAGDLYRQNMSGPLEKARESEQGWAARKWQEINQVTGSNPRLRLAIANGGEWHPTPESMRGLMARKGSAALVPELQRINDDFGSAEGRLQAELSQASPDMAAVRALRKQQQDLMEEEVKLTKKLDQRMAIYLMGEDKRFASILQEEFNNGRYTMPGKIVSEERVVDDQASRLEHAGKFRREVSSHLYTPLGLMTRLDMRGPRGSYFSQAWRARFDDLLARGYSPEMAKNLAQWRGARETADHLYDLAARSSMHKFFQNVFWFMPAYQEMLGTWFKRLPEEVSGQHNIFGIYGGWVTQIYPKIANIVQLAQNMGWIKKDQNGKEYVDLPEWATGALMKMTGAPDQVGPNREHVFFYLQGLSMLSSGAFFGLPSPAAGSTLVLQSMANAVQNVPWVGKFINDTITKMNNALTIPGVPNSLLGGAWNFAWERAFHSVPPWEAMSNSLVEAHQGKAFDDAMAMAVYTLDQEGVQPPPNLSDNATAAQRIAYNESTRAYHDHVMAETNKIYNSWLGIQLLGSTLFPSTLHVTTDYRREITEVKSKIYADGKISPQETQLLDNWIAQHPSSLAYRLKLSEQTTIDPKDVLPTQHGIDDKRWQRIYNQQIQDSKRQAVPAEEQYQRYLALREYEHVSNLMHNGLTMMLPDGVTLDDPKALGIILRHHGEYSHLTQKAWEDYNAWKTGNPTADAVLQQTRLDWANIYGKENVPVQSLVALQAQQGFRILQHFAEEFTSDGIPSTEFKTVLTKMEQIWVDNTKYGPPTTAFGKGMQFYMSSITPYYDKVNTLRLKAQELTSEGRSAEAATVYDQIRTFTNDPKWSSIKWRGTTLPSPEEFAWTKLTEHQQDVRKEHWLAQNPGWLTDFEAEKVGYPNTDAMWAKLNEVNTVIEATFAAKGFAPTDPRINEAENAAGAALAKAEFGADGVKQFALSLLAPYARLKDTPLMVNGQDVQQDQTWQGLVGFADYTTSALQQAQLSPKGNTGAAAAIKSIFWAKIDEARASDPAVNKLLIDLGQALAKQGVPREGPALYDALFFGQFTFPYVPATG